MGASTGQNERACLVERSQPLLEVGFVHIAEARKRSQGADNACRGPSRGKILCCSWIRAGKYYDVHGSVKQAGNYGPALHLLARRRMSGSSGFLNWLRDLRSRSSWSRASFSITVDAVTKLSSNTATLTCTRSGAGLNEEGKRQKVRTCQVKGASGAEGKIERKV
jgi:hypothetical protein